MYNKDKKKEYNRTYRIANKDAINIKRKAYREKNQSKIKSYRKFHYEANKTETEIDIKLYREENKNKINEYNKVYRETNLDKIKKKNKIWYEANLEWVKKSKRVYRDANPGKTRADYAKRRATKLRATPKWLTEEHWKEIEDFYFLAQELAWLNQDGKPFHVDHIVPLRGNNICGLHVPWNLQLLPARENMSKGNR